MTVVMVPMKGTAVSTLRYEGKEVGEGEGEGEGVGNGSKDGGTEVKWG